MNKFCLISSTILLASAGRAQPMDLSLQLAHRWLALPKNANEQPKLEYSDFAKVLAIFKLDPESLQIMDKARDSVDAKSFEAFFGFFRVCPRNPDGTKRGAANTSRKNGKLSICLPEMLRLRGAYLLILHESIHLAAYASEHMVFRVQADFKSAGDYALKQVLSPGDEVDAYTAEYAAKVRLEIMQGTSQLHRRDSLPSLVKAFYDDNAKFIGDRAELAKVILDQMGYRKKLEDQFLALPRR